MKILALVSGHRKKGNTARIVQTIEAHLQAIAARQQQPLEFDTLYLGDLNVQFCRGCRTCFDRGEDKCPLKDDVPVIRARMDAADGVIVASPIYMDDVNGIAKNWIDRLACISHRPAFGGKCAYPLVTVGSSQTGHALRTLNAALLVWGFHLMEQAELERRYQREAARVAEQLFRAVVEQQALRPSFVSLLAFKIQ